MDRPKHNKRKPIAKPLYKNMNAFKAVEKHYKFYQGIPTDFSTLFQPKPEQFVEVGGYQVCELPFPSGAYLVKNFCTPYTAIEVGLRGLNQFCCKPYRTNLDSREQLYQEDKTEEKAQQEEKDEKTIHKEQYQKKEISPENAGQKGYVFNDKIRWANVGCQYDWTLRKYPDKKTSMHPLLADLAGRANSLFNTLQHTDKAYEAEAAIINYYGLKDYMTGHLDDAQQDQISPIYSFSFGLSCIFVIGGRTKDEVPTSVQLDSGDLLIMSGQSRLCYHGVPRVLPDTELPPLTQQQKQNLKQVQELGSNTCGSAAHYLRSHRININIRQVFARGQ